MPAAMPCKTPINSRGETCRTPDSRKTKYACIVEADESTRKRLEGTLLKDHEDHIAGRRINSLSHYNLVNKFILMLQAMKLPDARAAVDKEWENLETIPAWQLTSVSHKKEVIDEPRKEAKQIILLHQWTSVISRIRSWNHNFKNTKVELCSEVI